MSNGSSIEYLFVEKNVRRLGDVKRRVGDMHKKAGSTCSKKADSHVEDIAVHQGQHIHDINHSTSTALISVCHHILSTLDSKNSICGIFLDVKKAFDSVSHQLLMNKLSSSLSLSSRPSYRLVPLIPN